MLNFLLGSERIPIESLNPSGFPNQAPSPPTWATPDLTIRRQKSADARRADHPTRGTYARPRPLTRRSPGDGRPARGPSPGRGRLAPLRARLQLTSARPAWAPPSCSLGYHILKVRYLKTFLKALYLGIFLEMSEFLKTKMLR